jgi:hypothetical protein
MKWRVPGLILFMAILMPDVGLAADKLLGVHSARVMSSKAASGSWALYAGDSRGRKDSASR